jgi:hypothetical protein
VYGLSAGARRAARLWPSPSRRNHHLGVRRWLLVAAVTVAVIVLLGWSLRSFGPRSAWFALAVVWLPMTWLGTLSRVITPRLPDGYHRLRRFEADGRVYELVGVRIAKSILRRGPLSWFNPDLHLPPQRTADQLARLEQRMRDAEASHAILLALTLTVVVHAAARGWWVAAGLTLLFDVLVNGYPVMLQRYNRARLAQRFGTPELG